MNGLVENFTDLTELWHSAADYVWTRESDELDYRTGLTTGVYDNLLSTESMAFDMDVGEDLWLTKSRFSKLQRDYLVPQRVELFLDQVDRIAHRHARRGVVAQMLCKTHDFSAIGKASQGAHTWGNCMLAMTYHGGPKYRQPTLGLHSRVTYIGYLGGMDLALCYILGKLVAEQAGIEVEELAFRWHLDAMQWHGMKSVPFVVSHDDFQEKVNSEDSWPDDMYPTILATRRSIKSMNKKREAGRHPQDEKYGPVKRMRTRFEYYLEQGTSYTGTTPVDDLTLESLWS